jgi:hypothetical protein
MKKYLVEFIGPFFLVLTVRMTVMKLAKVSHLWIYRVANPGAGALAACVFRMINPEDKQFAVDAI